MRIAVRDWGEMPIRSRRSKVSLRLRPASIRRRVFSVASSVAFPVLDDASTQPFTMNVLPLDCMITHYNGSTPMKARVYVSYKTTVLDPQGQTIQSALNGLGHKTIMAVRQGKFFDIEIQAGEARDKVQREMDEVARDVLANPVMEDYRVEILD